MEKNLEQINLLRKNFESAVKGYIKFFCKQFDIEYTDNWWLNDDISSGVFFWNDCNAITIEEIIFCVEKGVSYKEWFQWNEYNIQCIEFGLDTINLRSWHNGAPRIEQSTFDKLKKLKTDFEKAVIEARKKINF